MLLNLVPSSDTKITTALSDKGRDIGGGKEDQSDRQVLDKGNIEAVLAAELDVGALKEVKCSSIEATLFMRISMARIFVGGRINSLLGTANRRRPSRLERILRQSASGLVGCRLLDCQNGADQPVDEIHGGLGIIGTW